MSADGERSDEDLGLKQQLELYAGPLFTHNISKLVEGGNQIPICKTEAITNDHKPTWNPILLNIQQVGTKVLKSRLFVERVQDTDPGLQKVALESMRFLALTMSADGERESLKFRLEGSEGDIGSWGP